MVGRIYRVDTLGDGPRARTSFEFDALDETNVTAGEDLRGLFLSDNVKPFGLVRVLTTLGRFAKLFGGEPQEGDWYRFELVPRTIALKRRDTNRLTAWHAQLTDAGYTLRSRGYIAGAEFLAREGEGPLKSLSAALAPTKAQRQAAIAAAQFPNFGDIIQSVPRCYPSGSGCSRKRKVQASSNSALTSARRRGGSCEIEKSPRRVASLSARADHVPSCRCDAIASAATTAARISCCRTEFVSRSVAIRASVSDKARSASAANCGGASSTIFLCGRSQGAIA